MLNIGNHTSSAKGYVAMVENAVRIGGNTFGFFTRNPRGGKAKEIDEGDVTRFREIIREKGFARVVAHAPYTLNACSGKADIREFGWVMFKDDLRRMEYTPGQFYNFHPGSHVGQGAAVGIRMIGDMLNGCLWEEQTTTVLLETMSGKGSEVGRNFEEIREIIDRVRLNDKVGVCLDTCHVWDGGYDIVNDLDRVLEEFDLVIGLERLKAVHINDSQNPCGSHKDRHAKIGEGMIGAEALGRVVRHPALRELPFILETPNDDEGWAKEIELLRGFAESRANSHSGRPCFAASSIDKIRETIIELRSC